MKRVTLFFAKEDAEKGKQVIADMTDNPCDLDTALVELENGMFVCDFTGEDKWLVKLKKSLESLPNAKIVVSDPNSKQITEATAGFSVGASPDWTAMKLQLGTKEKYDISKER